MATQSGIQATPELSEAWSAALANPDTRLLKISIQDEQLVPSGTYPTSSSDSAAEDALETDFELFGQDGVAEEKTPAYYLFRLSPPPTSNFLFLSYVPDSAPVRSKMLYASTRATLLRSLGDARISSTLFATSRSDLSYASYLSHTKHEAAEAPLTAREAEVEAIRRAEKQQAEEAGEGDEESRRQGRSMIFGGSTEEKGSATANGAKGVLPWTDEAKEAVKALGIPAGEDGARDYAQLEIDVPNETVVLSPNQPTDLTLPASSPCYFFFRHAAGIVLIYSCPPSSPVKSRLVYSSAALVLYKVAVPDFTGLQVLKKLETDDPSEVTSSWVDAELGPLAAPSTAPVDADGPGASSASGSGTSTPLQQEDDKPKFARPQRPGRRR
ncbi:hypothetical protein JCM11251_000172 [Rhodosporidiobolus azoricus]